LNAFILFFFLLKATLTTFSGLASLKVLRQDLVLHHHVLTDRQLNTVIVVTRTTPGPVGVYVVSVGYFVDGVPGAIAGGLAMIAPGLLIIPLTHFMGRHATHPRVRSLLQGFVLRSTCDHFCRAVVDLRRGPAAQSLYWCTAISEIKARVAGCFNSLLELPTTKEDDQ
jgi:Chromate transporter